MKQIYFSLLILVIVNSFIYSQSRFFVLTEGWKDMAALEYNESYISIGLGFTGTFQNHLQFTKLDKQGSVLDEWIFKLDSTNTTEFSFQQAVTTNNFGERIIAGTITYSQETLHSIGIKLSFNDDFTVNLENNWMYAPFENSTQFRTAQPSDYDNNMMYSANYLSDNKVHSILMKTDESDNILWENSFSCSGNCWMDVRHLISTDEGGYIFTNNEERLTGGPGLDDHDVATIIKVDSVGEQQWRIYPGGVGLPYTSEYLVLQPTDDGNYLCAWADNFWDVPYGNVSYQRNPDATIWFAKIDPNGNKLWEKNIQEEIDLWDVAYDFYLIEQMIRLADDNFVMIYHNGIIKINQEAEVIWARRINPLGFESNDDQTFYYLMKGISQTSDGGLIATGEFVAQPGTVFPEFTQSGFVLKLDEYGCFEADCQEDDPVSIISLQLSVKEMSIYPNPAKESVTLSYDIGQSVSRISLAVTDVAGRMVHEQVLTGIAGSVQVDTHKWVSGVYLCQLMVDGYVGGVHRVVITR